MYKANSMKISAKTDYACRALLELALHWPNPIPVKVETISERQKVPMKFLIHILIRLKELGLVESTRGKKGGYLLSKSPQEIKLSDLAKPFLEIGMENIVNKVKANGVFSYIWQEVDGLVIAAMEKITFEEICQRERSLSKMGLYAI